MIFMESYPTDHEHHHSHHMQTPIVGQPLTYSLGKCQNNLYDKGFIDEEVYTYLYFFHFK